jgi:transcriptional regulator GlxA family with amidase domain
VVAIASVSVDLRMPADGPGASSGLAAAVAVARSRCTENLSVAEIAGAAAMSSEQLERAMRRTMGVSPKQLVLRFRLEEAMRRLRETDAPIAHVASECGYYDQSAFSRQFKRVVGMSPGAYRGDRATGPTPW